MSHASAVSATFSLPDFTPLRQALRAGLHIAGAAAQVVGFAGVMWLLAAGPGFVSHPSSTVTVTAARTR